MGFADQTPNNVGSMEDRAFDACSGFSAVTHKNIFELMTVYFRDNGGRRLGIDRRQFSYAEHIPERRSGKDRRNGLDRRQKPRTPDDKRF